MGGGAHQKWTLFVWCRIIHVFQRMASGATGRHGLRAALLAALDRGDGSACVTTPLPNAAAGLVMETEFSLTSAMTSLVPVSASVFIGWWTAFLNCAILGCGCFRFDFCSAVKPVLKDHPQ